MNNFFSKPKLNVNRILVLSFITIVFEVLLSLPFIILFQANKPAGESTWLIVGNVGLIFYPVLVYFGISIISLFNKETFKFSFLERLVSYMVFGNAVNFIIHLLTNIPEQFDLIKLIQVTFILFGVNIVIRLIAIFLFEPFNLFIERYQRKLRPTVTETSEEESVLVSTNSDENQSTINEDSPTQPQEAQQIDPTEIN